MGNERLLICGVGFIVTLVAFLATLPPTKVFKYLPPEGWKEAHSGKL